MSKLKVPMFKSYREEAEYWDNLDTANFMDDDGKWFQLETQRLSQPETDDVVAQALEGLRDAEAGLLISTEELLKKVDKW